MSVFSGVFCEIYKNTFFTEDIRETASVNNLNFPDLRLPTFVIDKPVLWTVVINDVKKKSNFSFLIFLCNQNSVKIRTEKLVKILIHFAGAPQIKKSVY